MSLVSLQGSLQIYLKSKNGPIEVYLCPEEGLDDASPVKSALTPRKVYPQPIGPSSACAMVPQSSTVKEEPMEGKIGAPVFIMMNCCAGDGMTIGSGQRGGKVKGQWVTFNP